MAYSSLVAGLCRWYLRIVPRLKGLSSHFEAFIEQVQHRLADVGDIQEKALPSIEHELASATCAFGVTDQVRERGHGSAFFSWPWTEVWTRS